MYNIQIKPGLKEEYGKRENEFVAVWKADNDECESSN